MEAWDDWEPNAETLAAMEEADNGIGLKSFDTIEELFEYLESDEDDEDGA